MDPVVPTEQVPTFVTPQRMPKVGKLTSWKQFSASFFLAAINGIFIDYHRLIAQIDSWNLFVGFNRLLEVQK